MQKMLRGLNIKNVCFVIFLILTLKSFSISLEGEPNGLTNYIAKPPTETNPDVLIEYDVISNSSQSFNIHPSVGVMNISFTSIPIHHQKSWTVSNPNQTDLYSFSINLAKDKPFSVNLSVPSNCDYDLYLNSGAPCGNFLGLESKSPIFGEGESITVTSDQLTQPNTIPENPYKIEVKINRVHCGYLKWLSHALFKNSY